MAKTPNISIVLASLFALLLPGALTSRPVSATTNPPVLISQETSTRAIAVESLCFTSEPFALASPCAWDSDRRTRVMLFAMNLRLQPGEDLSNVTADAEDAAHQRYDLTVEYVGPVPQHEWMSSVILKLNNNLGDVGDVLVRVSHNGVSSNRVRIGIGHIGGGPADDDGAPTPAPPYTISGQITLDGLALSDVSVKLSGAQETTFITDASGVYALVASTVGDYTVEATKLNYNFSPPTISFSNLSNHRSGVNFIATRKTYTISGQLRDDNNQALDGLEVTLVNETEGTTRTSITGNGGNYSFANLPAAHRFTITPSTTAFFSFSSQSIDMLSDNRVLDFTATRRAYSISGRLTGTANVGLAGLTINLTGFQNATTLSDNNGNFMFAGLPAGRNYTVTVPTTPYYTFSTQSLNELSGNQVADFQGTLRSYTVSGRAQLGPNAAPGLVVQISGSQTLTLTTGDDGRYSVSLPAGGDYTLTPSLLFWEFAPATQVVTDLTSDQLNRNFNGFEQEFTISGQLMDQENHGLAGLTVNLAGRDPRTTVSDASGHYEFRNQFAGFSYTVTPLSTYDYKFTAQTITQLTADQTLNFTGLRRLTLNGTVRDKFGNGIIGVTVTLAGTESDSTITGPDGSYSLRATATGSYTVTPSMVQNPPFVPPSGQFINLAAEQTTDFTATLVPVSEPSYVLEFDGTPKTVDYGQFWPEWVDLGHFYWEFWAMPGPNASATYLLSDGYGGAHALLFGVSSFNTSEPNRYELLGNTFDGVNFDHYFGSDQGPAVNEWGHFAVGWDGQNIITYFNGVPVGKTPFHGPRRTPGFINGGGRLLIGGSDHSNFAGRIAQVRGYEDFNPREGAPGSVEAAFAPQTVFQIGGSLLSYYFRPSPRLIADLSPGFRGISHPGFRRGTGTGILDYCEACPPPQFVIDPTAPNFAAGTPPQQVDVPTPPAAPGGALVFDSFSRANSTYLFGSGGGLGSTESGSAGTQLWQTNQSPTSAQPFGILNSIAVLLANDTALAWVPTGSATGNLDVRVERRTGRWGRGIHTGLSFRVVDANNFFFAYTTESGGTPNTRVLKAGYYVHGQRVELATSAALPGAWTTLRVITAETGELRVYADDTLVYSTSSPLLTTATGAGLYNNSYGLGLVNRWDNFSVFSAP